MIQELEKWLTILFLLATGEKTEKMFKDGIKKMYNDWLEYVEPKFGLLNEFMVLVFVCIQLC